MNRIIILIILTINLCSCQNQRKKENFEILTEISENIKSKKNVFKTFRRMDSIHPFLDGADSEFYIDLMKGIIITNYTEYKKYLKDNDRVLDKEVLYFFKQDKKIFFQLMNNVFSNRNLGVINDTDGFVYLRKDNNVNSKIIQKIENEDLIIILKEEGNWYKIETVEKQQGFIHSSRVLVINTLLDNWQGVYSFGFGRADKNYEMSFEINRLETKIIDFQKKKIKAGIVRILNDTIELNSFDNRQYILYREKEGLNYAITGHDIYILNPPNDNYPLRKEK